MDLVFDSEHVDIFYGFRLVTSHNRNDTPYGYSRKDSHNLPGHHGSFEKDLEEIFSRAGEIDNILLGYLKEVAILKKYPPQAFRSCRGIMSLEKKYGLDRLVAACACATELKVYGYQEVLDILSRGADADFLEDAEEKMSFEGFTAVQHKNIRGRDYFSKLTNSKNNNNEHK